MHAFLNSTKCTNQPQNMFASLQPLKYIFFSTVFTNIFSSTHSFKYYLFHYSSLKYIYHNTDSANIFSTDKVAMNIFAFKQQHQIHFIKVAFQQPFTQQPFHKVAFNRMVGLIVGWMVGQMVGWIIIGQMVGFRCFNINILYNSS